MKKRLLVENDINELDDFQKILLLNKKKLDIDDIYFIDDEGEDYSDIIELDSNGIIFNFDDLEQFLKFFFPNEYKESSEGEYDATMYDRMYYKNYDFYNDCADRTYDDWKEGYVLSYLCDPALRKLKEIIDIIDPSMSDNFTEKDGKLSINNEDGMVIMLDKVFSRMENDVNEIICSGKGNMISEEAQKYIGDTYCNGLEPLGIENFSTRFDTCFKTYFISWGNLVQMFIDRGEFNDNALDVLFSYIDKNFKNHAPTYYEIEYNVWNQESFEEYTCDDLTKLMDEFLEEVNDNFNPGFKEVIEKLTKLDLYKPTKIPSNDDYGYLRVISVDPKTLQVKYKLSKEKYAGYNDKMGISPVDEVISMLTQPSLFNPSEFRVDPSRDQR